MAKRKKQVSSNNDMKITAIIIGLCGAAILLFVIFLKGHESHEVVHKVVHRVVYRVSIPQTSEVGDAYIPTESIKPVEPMPSQPATAESFKNISGSGGKIAIIIDDWGQSTSNCRYLKEIPEPLAVSILPGLRHTKDVANCAMMNHKLTMLHLPLEALHNYDFYPPDYIIKTSMSPSLVAKIVGDDLSQLPSIEGVNNHMGSKATEDRSLMRIVFKMIRKKGLFFVDSMTAHDSVCTSLADEMGLNFGKRDVFLDNINTREAIAKQFIILAQKARHRGYAVAIGHDRRLTMQVIKEEMPLLESEGFEIVSIKSLLKNK